jgi:hypothetical protein
MSNTGSSVSPAPAVSSTPSPLVDPLKEYQARRDARQSTADEHTKRERLVGNGRVVVFLLILLLGWFAFAWRWFHPLWLLPVVGFFVWLLFLHEKVTRAWFRARRAVGFYQSGLSRLSDEWRGRGQLGTRYLDEQHPYAADLDLFGKGSLFELLCTARTRTGEDTLASWLKAGANPEEIRKRQEAVAELKPKVDLREDLALLGSDLPAGVDFDGVVAWGAAPVLLVAQWPRWVAMVLGLLTLTALAGFLLATFELLAANTWFGQFFNYFGAIPLAIMLVVQLSFVSIYLKRVNEVLASVEQRGRDLFMLSSVLSQLENTTFSAAKLAGLHSELDPADHSISKPSEQIAELGNLIDVLNSRRNQFFAPFAYLSLWGTQCAHAIEKWRARSGPHIGRWLAIVGEFEALCALATYAYENPADPFPEIVDVGPVYRAESLGHPLLPRGKAVTNNVELGEPTKVLIVSGSNMSGKSTYLRTIGINAVLALAGAPVRAKQVRISPLLIGATLRIQDSLQEGRSRFYAEILRARLVVDLSREKIPLLFLLDEIFAGTNSHDRCVGAEAVVRGLVKTGAIGLVTTHDLTLTKIADSLPGQSHNVHFADHFEEGVMKFDYTLRNGIVQNSNALALMRAVGLEV